MLQEFLPLQRPFAFVKGSEVRKQASSVPQKPLIILISSQDPHLISAYFPFEATSERSEGKNKNCTKNERVLQHNGAFYSWPDCVTL